MNIEPIAFFRSPFPSKFGSPRQSGLVPELPGRIVFTPPYRHAEAVRGLEGFDYLWLIWEFHASASQPEGHERLTVRPPRLGGNERVGVFASRSPFRPNSLGLSCVYINKVELTDNEGPVIHVLGADLMDGTPIFDVKPYVSYADAHPEARSGFVDQREWKQLEVEMPDELARQFSAQQLKGLKQTLALDPRPQFHDAPDRIYGMPFAGRDVQFRVADGIVHVVRVVLLLLALLLTFPTLVFSQEEVQQLEPQTIEGLVVDAETGQPLPFASVTTVPATHLSPVAQKRSTITNAEGSYRIVAYEGEQLRFSYAGFKAVTLSLKSIGHKVKLQPSTMMIHEVNVKALPLKQIRKETVRQQKKYRKKTSDYFYRQTAFVDSTCYEYVEAFLSGHSAVALNELRLDNGRYAGVRSDTTAHQVLHFYKNFFTFSQIELATNRSQLSPIEDIMPLYEKASVLYDIDYDLLSDSAGAIYVIRFQPKDFVKGYTILDCTLYVDSVTKHILRCDGSGRNFRILQQYPKQLKRKDEVLPVVFNFSINMTEENGFTEVQSVYVDTYHHVDSALVRTKSTLFNVGLHKGKKGKDLRFTDDLHTRIDNQKYNRDFWQQNEIVRRTRTEEAVLELFERRDLFGVF